MPIQKYDLQHEQLIKLKQFLQQFDNEIQHKLSEYKQRIANLREAGLPCETAEKFTSEILPQTEHYIHKNSDYIQNLIIPFLNKNIETLDELLNNGTFSKSENKIGTRIAAFGGAVVAAVSGAVALGFQREDKNYAGGNTSNAYHTTIDSPTKTPWDAVREMAGDINDTLAASTDERKRSEEIKEQSTPYPKSEQEEYRDV